MSDETRATKGSVRWARVLGLAVLLLVAGEAACRVGVRVWLGQPFRSFDGYVFSGYGVYRQNPCYTHPAFRHNSVGFRNLREFSIEKPERTLRVMGIGASVLYAGSAPVPGGASRRVRTDETITAYLEPLLRAMPELEGFDLEVINASTNRHHFREVIPYYAAELARYQPDIVLIFGTNNDGRWLEFRGAGDEMFFRPEHPTSEEARLSRLANEASFAALMEKTVRVAVNRSALAAVSYRVLDVLLQRLNAAISRVDREPVRRNMQRPLATPEERERNLRIYLAGLGTLTTLVELHGAQPLVFWEYLLTSVEDEKPLSAYEQHVSGFLRRRTGGPSPELKRLRAESRDRVAQFLAARGVPMIDLLEDLRGYDGTVFNDYLHYNHEGNRWVAGRLAERLAPFVRAWVAAQDGTAGP